jgi:amino acid transporter
MNSINFFYRDYKFKHYFIILAILMISALSVFHFGQTAKAANSLWDMQDESFKTDVGQMYGSDTPTDIRVVIANLIKVFLGLLAIIFLVLILLAGFRWMTAAGNQDQIKVATAQIRNAVIGLVIILASYAITVFVMNVLVEGMAKKT